MNNDLHISHEGLELIKRWEGCILTPYQDIVSIWTLGVGHVLTPEEHVQYANGITLEKALDILAIDVKRFEDAIKTNITVELNTQQFSALTSLCFNCGTKPISPGHGIHDFLNSGQFDKIPTEWILWAKAGGKINQGLLNRRKDELHMFLTPVKDQELTEEEKQQILNTVTNVSNQIILDDETLKES